MLERWHFATLQFNCEGTGWCGLTSILALLSRTRHPGMVSLLSLQEMPWVANVHPNQPDGYLTEERKAADPDQGFSTFFSETGMRSA